MMKRKSLMMFAIMMVTLGAFAQNSESTEGGNHKRFLTDEECMKCVLTLPQPPSENSENLLTTLNITNGERKSAKRRISARRHYAKMKHLFLRYSAVFWA